MKDTNYIRRDFHSVTLVMPQGGLGVPRGSIFFFKHGHVAYHIDRDDKQNKMQVTFSSKGQTSDLRVRSKGQISLNFPGLPLGGRTPYITSKNRLHTPKLHIKDVPRTSENS